MRLGLLLVVTAGCGEGVPTAPLAGAQVGAECADDRACGAGVICRSLRRADGSAFGFCYPASRPECSRTQCCPGEYRCLGSALGQREVY